ncbi:GNAT family N-acetyltransferase [Pseudonocardia sp. TRM90224]|uniref:GNAT family N-acetyltransferase n=1 Tax=Pseudonocardia sp. TRM90224 TaxID=2812678 RepID=UPI001E47D9E8|nr:GNAT family N-acetyltransferase [Pseudonocardia sp. TRM90224]
MDPLQFNAGQFNAGQFNAGQFSAAAPATVGTRAVLTRVDDQRWQAVEDDRTVGEGEASRRTDGRIFLSIDTWHGAVFDRLAAAMLADLPGPLYTMVDEADHDLTARWQRAGLTVRRREVEYHAATEQLITGLGPGPAPSGVTILGLGAAREPALREVYETVRAEVDARLGWDSMPVEVPPRPVGAALDPSRYAVAAVADRYVGLVRVVSRRRHARIGLLAVREDQRRRGIAKAMLAEVLGALHRAGVETVSTEVDERNSAATALCEGIGAQRVSSALEMVRGA